MRDAAPFDPDAAAVHSRLTATALSLTNIQRIVMPVNDKFGQLLFLQYPHMERGVKVRPEESPGRLSRSCQ